MTTPRRANRLAAARQRRDRDDTGATLILALIFLVVIGLTVVGLVRWTGNDLSNSSKFYEAQSVQSAANSANQFAIQFVRYNFLETGLDGATPASCWEVGPGEVSATALNNQTVDSWCMTLSYPGVSTSQRIVTVSTCASGVSASSCALQPLLQSIVKIVDGGGACSPQPNPVSNNTCGQSMSISDWQFGATPPVVTSAANGSFTCTSGLPVVVTGTNLTYATGVDFLEQSTAGSPNGGQVMARGTMAFGATSFNSPSSSTTTIDVCAPAALTPPTQPATTFYVIVSTPLGSNENGASSSWTS